MLHGQDGLLKSHSVIRISTFSPTAANVEWEVSSGTFKLATVDCLGGKGFNLTEQEYNDSQDRIMYNIALKELRYSHFHSGRVVGVESPHATRPSSCSAIPGSSSSGGRFPLTDSSTASRAGSRGRLAW